RSANRQPDEDYAPVYYPGTTDLATAVTVNVAAGAQLRGVDFALSKIRTIRIKGRVINATGSGRNQARLTLMPRDQIGYYNMNRPTMTDPNGAFEIRGVAPGSYTLMASIYDSDRSYSTRQAIDAGSSNIENVSLTISRSGVARQCPRGGSEYGEPFEPARQSAAARSEHDDDGLVRRLGERGRNFHAFKRRPGSLQRRRQWH